MPLTLEQEKWLEAVEYDRAKESEEYVKALIDKVASKKAKKGKEGETKKAAKKEGKGKDKKKGGDSAKMSATGAAAAEQCKYKSAEQFMARHFPNFDPIDLNTEVELPEEGQSRVQTACGPMRTMHLIECQRILEVCEQYDVPMDAQTLERALIVPQDRPEGICMEGHVRDIDRLMPNPLPKEYWRPIPEFGKKKKKGGKKK